MGKTSFVAEAINKEAKSNDKNDGGQCSSVPSQSPVTSRSPSNTWNTKTDLW